MQSDSACCVYCLLLLLVVVVVAVAVAVGVGVWVPLRGSKPILSSRRPDDGS